MWNIPRKPVLFCISLILTEQLNRLHMAYEEHTTKTKISHLLYMDNLKLKGKSVEELQKQLSVMISIWNLDFPVVQRLCLRKENKSTCKI
jgi:hypothetical protein